MLERSSSPTLTPEMTDLISEGQPLNLKKEDR
jgi:hypothetical protein